MGSYQGYLSLIVFGSCFLGAGSRDLIEKERKGVKDMSGKEESRHVSCLIHLGVNHHLPMLRKVQRWEKRRTGGCLGENKENKGKEGKEHVGLF